MCRTYSNWAGLFHAELGQLEEKAFSVSYFDHKTEKIVAVKLSYLKTGKTNVLLKNRVILDVRRQSKLN